jgi:hypothetical protein
MHVELDLRPEEKRVIAIFQDESCFHVNDNKPTVMDRVCDIELSKF